MILAIITIPVHIIVPIFILKWCVSLKPLITRLRSARSSIKYDSTYDIYSDHLLEMPIIPESVFNYDGDLATSLVSVT